MKSYRSRRRTLMMRAAAPALALALVAGAANAQEARRAFDIAPQPLADALLRLARQADIDIVAAADLTRGRTAPGVRGELTAAEAMTQLLAGSGLEAQPAGGGYILARASAPQSGSAAGGGAEVEALIVTAQKREEDIQDVPIAISAFTQEDLTRSQVAGGPDLITQVPNMTFTKTNFSSYSIQIRGIGTQAISATTDAAVAVAFNNTPFIRNRFFEQEFYDLQRVEVLRGPQGTLYGRNATAGVVNIISAKPKFRYEAKLSADIANYSSTRVEGMINIPLAEDVVALRLAGAWTKRNGFVTNELTGNSIDGRDLWSTRASLRLSPSDALDINLIWEHFEEDDDRLRSGKQLCKKDIVTKVGDIDVPYLQVWPGSQSGIFAGVQATLSQGCERASLYSPEAFQTPNGLSVPFYAPLGAVGLPIALNDPYVSATQSQDLRVIESTQDPGYRAKADLAELQVSLEIADGLTLDSETAYSADFVFSTQDFNRFNTAPGAWRQNPGPNFRPGALTPGPNGGSIFCDPQVGCSDRLVAIDLSTAKYRQFSQEFRLGSDFDGPFNFSLGTNLLRFDGEDKYYVFINSLTLSGLSPITFHADPLSQYVGGVSDDRECLIHGYRESDPSENYGYTCVYIDPNPIGSLNDKGHNYFLSKNPYRLISYALFGEAYYELADNLKVTAGLRWTVDKKHAPRIPSWALAGMTWGYPVLEIIDQEWREPTGRLALDWKPDLAFTDETMVYASYAHGYKAGGANPPPFVSLGQDAGFYGAVSASETRPRTFEPEFVDAFELGTKNTLADGRVTLNLASFYYDYKDYQISEIVDRSAFNRNFDATVWGLEVEADWRPLENLRLGFKGGYENTSIADGERAIDLMDRTAGVEGWVVVRPFPTFASSCILPEYLFHNGNGGLIKVGNVGGGMAGGCERAYLAGLDPLTGLAGEPYAGPVPVTNYPDYQGFDPLIAPNKGEGFTKDLSGNALPNAPEFTATLTADYTLPLPNDWLVNLHTDLYWQAESWWRVFDDHEYGKLDEYFTMNLAAIFTNEERGWNVMAYVKNVFDRDSITGAFLNSDDTALTTNVFLTEPRLYGLRVTKTWTGGPLLGSFGERSEGPFPFVVELSGQAQRHDAPYAIVRPTFTNEFSPVLDIFGDEQNPDMDWGDGRAVKLTYRPGGAWLVSAGIRSGETNGGVGYLRAEEAAERECIFGGIFASRCATAPQDNPNVFVTKMNWADSRVDSRESHQVADFSVGRDIGFGGLLRSTIALGLRHARLESASSVRADGVPDWDIVGVGSFPGSTALHTRYEGEFEVERRFEGVGPAISWEGASELFGSERLGNVDLDWAVTAGVLFGKQEASVSGEEHSGAYDIDGFLVLAVNAWSLPVVTERPSIRIDRSQDVSVPVADLSLGLSYRLDRMSIGAGYRWERYFDAIDGGFQTEQSYDRTIDGPYFKIAVGFGG